MRKTWMILLLLTAPAQAAFMPIAEHDDLVASATGYFAAAGGTGGQGGRVVYVRNLNDSGPGSMRSFLESTETLIVLFEDGLNGTINLTTEVKVESNKTIWGLHRDGSSADVLVSPAPDSDSAFKIRKLRTNVIIANLKGNAFGPDDLAPTFVTIRGPGGVVWVHHVTVFGDGTQNMDGFVDVQSEGVTISWNNVIDWDSVHLQVVFNDPDTGPNLSTVTYHHNLYERIGARTPRVVGDNMFAHFYNNVVIDWDRSGSNAVRGGRMILENNLYIAGDDVHAILGTWEGSGNVFLNGATAVPQTPGLFTVPYSYTLDPVDGLLADLRSRAGWQEFAPVPEPASWILLLIGTYFLGRWRR